MEERPGVGDEGGELPRAGEVGVDRLVHLRRLEAVEVGEDGRVVRQEGAGEGDEAVGVDEVGDPDAGPVRLRLVGRSDAARGRADVGAAERLLPRAVEEGVGREDDVGAVGELQVLAHLDARGPEARDLGDEGPRVDDEAVADDVQDPLPADAGRDEAEGEVAVFELDGVAGVVAALVARDDVEGGGDQVDDLPLPLVAPLPPDDHEGVAGRIHRTILPAGAGIARMRESPTDERTPRPDRQLPDPRRTSSTSPSAAAPPSSPRTPAAASTPRAPSSTAPSARTGSSTA